MLLILLIIIEIVCYDTSELLDFESVLVVIFVRFVAAIILHLCLMDELTRAMTHMKYSVNHSYRFKSWFASYISALMQSVVLVLVELICIAVICISLAPMAIVYNFIALAIIGDFDEYIYSSYSDCL